MTSERLRLEVMEAVSHRGLVSVLNNTKWSELQNAVRQELLFPPPYQVKYVLNSEPEPLTFEANEFWGDWSHESLYSFLAIEWVRIRLRSLRRRGSLVGPDAWSVESDLLRILHRFHIPYRHDGESVWVYGYASHTDEIRPNAVEFAPPVVHPLAESARYLMGHSRETVILVDKVSGQQTTIAYHSGDPQAGVITPDEAWFVSGGNGVVCHHTSGEQLSFFSPGCPPDVFGQPSSDIFVHGLRLDNHGNVRVLLRPWESYASIWQIDLSTRSVLKLREGPFPRSEWWRWTEF